MVGVSSQCWERLHKILWDANAKMRRRSPMLLSAMLSGANPSDGLSPGISVRGRHLSERMMLLLLAVGANSVAGDQLP